ncbi:hypothetical protein HGRIS_011553 [Hohenbuehelia grisea]|uniref:J domain-containing protein n=1 Tax=Hohenbuehelia grisea TaxID=104357 RepID=A0ABR3JVF6_9AGAR
MRIHRPRLELIRQASSSLLARSISTHPSHLSSHFPFPLHSRPTPHEIFHLPHGASQNDIKTRYYELVRAHHPDSTYCRSLSAAERHKRFQSITAAYDALRGKKPHVWRDPYVDEVMRRKRAYYSHYSQRPRPEYSYAGRHDWHASADDRWKDRIILFVGITVRYHNLYLILTFPLTCVYATSLDPRCWSHARSIHVPSADGETTPLRGFQPSSSTA